VGGVTGRVRGRLPYRVMAMDNPATEKGAGKKLSDLNTRGKGGKKEEETNSRHHTVLREGESRQESNVASTRTPIALGYHIEGELSE